MARDGVCQEYNKFLNPRRCSVGRLTRSESSYDLPKPVLAATPVPSTWYHLFLDDGRKVSGDIDDLLAELYSPPFDRHRSEGRMARGLPILLDEHPDPNIRIRIDDSPCKQ